MNTLRLEFEELQKSKYKGPELMFETSNNKYIEWLEQKIVKNCNIPKQLDKWIEDSESKSETSFKID